VDSIQSDFGTAGEKIVIEEYLTGEEISFLAFTDGYSIVPFPPAQDHKRIFEGDTVRNILITRSNIVMELIYRDPIREEWEHMHLFLG
jgi:hypothetical protein